MSNLPQDGKAYIMTCVKTGTVVDLNAIDLKTVSGWQPNGGKNQNWIFQHVTSNNYRIMNEQTNTNGYLTASSTPDGNGLYRTFALPAASTPGDQLQLWAVAAIADETDTYVIGSVGQAGNVVDLDGSNPANGTPILSYPDHSGNRGGNQQWILKAAPN